MSMTLIAATSAFLLAISVLYTARQVHLLRKQHKENHDWNRRLTAQQAIREYQNIQEMVESLSEHFDYHNRTEGIPLTDFEIKFNEMPSLQSRLHALLNYFEGLARGVRQGIYDQEVVENAFQRHMIRVFESFKYYIEFRRRKVHNPTVYIELEIITSEWQKELRNAPPAREKIAAGS